MFKKVCIIGCGLIGSSIARAIRKQNLSTKIVSSNRSDSVNKKVIELKIVDDSNSDTKKMVEDSDLIIIATPLSSYEEVILKIKDSLKNGSILTDVGSVKESIIGLIEKHVPENVSWISLFIALAPMLGFMGTVIGMIQAFDKIQAAGDMQPSLVAGGIKVALLTTVFGLIVAIILQIFYNYIVSKIDSIVNDMEDASITLIDILVSHKK